MVFLLNQKVVFRLAGGSRKGTSLQVVFFLKTLVLVLVKERTCSRKTVVPRGALLFEGQWPSPVVIGVGETVDVPVSSS